jgi:hypothetical protein
MGIPTEDSTSYDLRPHPLDQMQGPLLVEPQCGKSRTTPLTGVPGSHGRGIPIVK